MGFLAGGKGEVAFALASFFKLEEAIPLEWNHSNRLRAGTNKSVVLVLIGFDGLCELGREVFHI